MLSIHEVRRQIATEFDKCETEAERAALFEGIELGIALAGETTQNALCYTTTADRTDRFNDGLGRLREHVKQVRGS